MSSVPVFELNNGNEIPAVAYGLGTVHFMGQEKDVSDVTVLALQNGFHHLDCAEAYMNEAGVGTGIKAAGLPREKLYISTKVVGTKDQDVAAALDVSLEKLGLDYVDLYLVHLPFSAGSGAGLQKIWSQVEALKKSGKAKSIGVSNFEKEDLEIILQTVTVTPAVNQIEFHPYLQHVELLRIPAKSPERLQGYIKAADSLKLSVEEVEQISELGKQKHHEGPTLELMGGAYGNYKLA